MILQPIFVSRRLMRGAYAIDLIPQQPACARKLKDIGYGMAETVLNQWKGDNVSTAMSSGT